MSRICEEFARHSLIRDHVKLRDYDEHTGPYGGSCLLFTDADEPEKGRLTVTLYLEMIDVRRDETVEEAVERSSKVNSEGSIPLDPCITGATCWIYPLDESRPLSEDRDRRVSAYGILYPYRLRADVGLLPEDRGELDKADKWSNETAATLMVDMMKYLHGQ